MSTTAQSPLGLFATDDLWRQPHRVTQLESQHVPIELERGLIVERFTFHDLRAKAGSDGTDEKLLGHMDPGVLRRVYRRRPELVNPTR